MAPTPCSLITTEANELLATMHDRMPVILPPDEYDVWLDPKADDKQRLLTLLRPFPAGEMEGYQVSTLVNNARNEDPACVERLAE